MKRALMISAAIALLTPVAANAQEANEDAPAVNAPEAVISEASDSQLDDLSIEELNALQLERLETHAYDMAEETGTEPMIVADETMAEEDPIFTIAQEKPEPEAAEEATELGGPFYESEEDAMQDSDLADTPDEPADETLPVPEEE